MSCIVLLCVFISFCCGFLCLCRGGGSVLSSSEFLLMCDVIGVYFCVCVRLVFFLLFL